MPAQPDAGTVHHGLDEITAEEKASPSRPMGLYLEEDLLKFRNSNFTIRNQKLIRVRSLRGFILGLHRVGVSEVL